MSGFCGTKSAAAFTMSYEVLHETFGRLYFWTFTAKDSSRDWEFANAWNTFNKRLNHAYLGEICGLRIFERHEGGGERDGELHCHAVVNVRVNINHVRRLARGTGIGQVMWVVKAWPGLNKYLCKYLTKDRRLRGIRSWAQFGGWDHVAVNHVYCDSPEANLYRSAYAEFAGDSHAWTKAQGRVAQILYSRLSSASVPASLPDHQLAATGNPF